MTIIKDIKNKINKKKMKKAFFTFLKGLAMGTVDIIPGVSGGTMALILKIYDKIIGELQKINLELFKNFFRGRFKLVFSQIDIKFLLALIIGIATAIMSLAHLISWGLQYYPTYLFSLFFGLIVISSILLIPTKNFKVGSIIFLIFGFAIAWIITTLSPANTPENYAFIFLSGAIAICAMILPGISGAFVLLLLGKYQFMLEAIKNPLVSHNIIIIAIFVLGCVIGLLSFSRFLNFLLKKYYTPTLLVLIGFMLGSLNKIWPFKLEQKNILPTLNQEFYIALGLAIIGIVIGYFLNKVKSEEEK